MNNIKTVSQIAVFSCVAQESSFTSAAKKLKVSKSAVSQQVKLLEDKLGTRLLNRSTRGMSLTAAGEKLLIQSNDLLEHIDLFFDDLYSEKDKPSGRFAITFPHSLQSTVILPAIESLCSEFPDLQPELVVDDSTLDLIKNNLDVAIRIGKLADSSYKALPAGMLTEIFCATPEYLKKHSTITSIANISQQRWIATPWQTNDINLSELDSGETKAVHLNQFSTANTLPAAIETALHHLGIILVPDIHAKPLIESGRLVHIAKQIIGPTWPIYTVHAYLQNKPKHITRFHELVTKILQNNV